jgi:hydrogenase-4 component B
VTALLLGIALVALGGVAALLAGRRARLASRLALAGIVPGSGAGLVGAVQGLAGGGAALRVPSSLPFGQVLLRLDPLGALFLAVLFTVAPLAAVYGAAYLARAGERRRLGGAWAFYALLVAGMALVLLAADGVSFLIAWEVMSLAAFFLVTFDDERLESREAGWTYLVATHIGSALLIAFFLLASSGAGSLSFAAMRGTLVAGGGLHTAAFLLAVTGFGIKAGFFPLHGWLPEAHPAAPSHVSALMSGVMIKMGVYGLLRAMTILGAPQVWWGWLLIAIGAASGVLGVLLALAQHDLKRLLAYHSVENVGIITLGLGLGVLGCATGSPGLALLGLAGGLFHVVNHALFKSLLFLGAGSVVHATGTRELDHLGGLLKSMPATGATFLVGAAAISGLPPLNGFASEFLIVLAAVGHGITGPDRVALPALSVLVALALIGGLAAACFAKAFGVTFLGEPRSEHARDAHESPRAMVGAMVVLAALCAAAAALSPLAVRALLAPVTVIANGLGQGGVAALAPAAATSLALALAAGGGGLALALTLALLRRALLRRRAAGETVTWGCGYLAPTARMQYTASSFAQPIVELVAPLLGTRTRLEAPAGLFPTRAALATETPDPATDRVLRPAFAWAGTVLARMRVLQQGRVQLYVLYIALTLVALLLWKVGRP